MKNTFLIPSLISRKSQFVIKLTKYEALSEILTVAVKMTRLILYLCRGDSHFVSKLTTAAFASVASHDSWNSWTRWNGYKSKRWQRRETELRTRFCPVLSHNTVVLSRVGLTGGTAPQLRMSVTGFTQSLDSILTSLLTNCDFLDLENNLLNSFIHFFSSDPNDSFSLTPYCCGGKTTCTCLCFQTDNCMYFLFVYHEAALLFITQPCAVWR